MVLLLGTGVALVLIYEDDVKTIVIKELNKNLKAEVRIDPKNIDLSFISSFPKCAIEFKSLVIMETWNRKEKDTLLYAENLSLLFSIKDIFDKKYDVKQIKLKKAKAYPKVDGNGKVNYEIWKIKNATSSTQSDSLHFKLENINLNDIRIFYRNKEHKIKINVHINEIKFTGDFNENMYQLTSEGNVFIDFISVEKTNYIRNKNLKMDVEFVVNNNNYQIQKADLYLNKMQFILSGDFNYHDSLQNLAMKYNAKNLDIESVLSLLPEKHKSRISDYQSSGEFFAEGNFNYESQKPLKIIAKFGVNKATVKYAPKNTKLDNISLAGELSIDGEKSALTLNNINANLNGDNFAGRFFVSNFNDPYIDVSANGVFNLLQVNSFWPMDTLEKLEGVLKFNGAVKGKISDLKERAFSEQISVQLSAEVTGFKAKFKNDTKELSVETCKIKAQERNVTVENLKLLRGNSDVDLTGEIPGFFNFIFDSKSPLVINGKLISKNLDIEDFIYSKTSSAEQSEFKIPANVNLQLDAIISHFVFNKFEATNINGNFELKNQKAMLSEMTFETMEGTASVNAFADASGNNLDVTLQAKIKNININKMFSQLNNFGQNTLTDKNVNGYITADIDFAGSWDKNLNSILNSITSSAELTIERGELNDFKPLESLSKFVDLKELQRIKFSSLSSNLQIKNKKIIIPQTTIKNSALNIEFSGTHDFDNNIDYHIRLLISELLAKKRKSTNDDDFGPIENDPENKRSAFILMTGNIDDIKIKYDKQGLKQKIKEDIKHEKQNLKQILKEEFGGFKNDTVKTKPGEKANQKFELEKPNNKPNKKPLEPKKKEEDDDDF